MSFYNISLYSIKFYSLLQSMVGKICEKLGMVPGILVTCFFVLKIYIQGKYYCPINDKAS